VHVISALGRSRQEDLKFEDNLGYILGPCHKGNRKPKQTNQREKITERERENYIKNSCN
jgi:hypothetical protein